MIDPTLARIERELKHTSPLIGCRFDPSGKFLFATAYDGDWDPYIEDFAAKIPAQMDVLFTAFEGWPGINSGQAVKDWIANHQIPAVGWYVAYPDLTVRDILRQQRVSKAVDEFLDKIN